MPAAARFRYTLVAGATAVVIGAGFTAVGLTRYDTGAAVPGTRGVDVPLAAPVPAAPAAGGAALLPTGGAASASPSAPASASPSASASRTPASPRATTVAPKPRPSTAPATRRPKPKPKPAPRPTGAPPATDGSVLGAVLAHINAARAREGLPAYTLDGDLSKASALHNQLMIGGCGLSHQCSGEGGIGDRFSAQGVRWNAAGENIGYGSAGGSDAAVVGAANGLTDSMLAEKAPDDGHRRNLLSKDFGRIGLSVVRDGKGVVWMTQDFVN